SATSGESSTTAPVIPPTLRRCAESGSAWREVKLREQLSIGFGIFAATLLVAVLLPLGLLLSREHLSVLRAELVHSGEAAARAWHREGVGAVRSRFTPVGMISAWAVDAHGVSLLPPS